MLYHQEFCPSCSNGQLGFYRCSDGKTLLLLCDECDAVAYSPEMIEQSSMDYLEHPSGVLLNQPGVSLRGGSSGWATSEEVEAAGWTNYIAKEV